MAAPLDFFTGQKGKQKDDFDEFNLMTANKTPAELKQERAEKAKKALTLGTDESMSSKSKSRLEGRLSPLSPRKNNIGRVSPLTTRSISAMTGRGSPTNFSESREVSR